MGKLDTFAKQAALREEEARAREAKAQTEQEETARHEQNPILDKNEDLAATESQEPPKPKRGRPVGSKSKGRKKKQVCITISEKLWLKLQEYQSQHNFMSFFIEDAITKAIIEYENQFGKLTDERIVPPSMAAPTPQFQRTPSHEQWKAVMNKKRR